ncbi:MAG TPA: NAD-dependent epimerase/dehydratase family protein [Candidatus Binatia bacterium]|nr:NAD-dependent epimerase/dehydratase family protein [Candidatus Binatia bacterium]
MRVFIAGVDGYLGWSLALYLARRGHDVGGMDAYYRRDWVAEVGSQSATPIRRMTERLEAFHDHVGRSLDFRRGDLRDYHRVLDLLRAFEPDAIVHLGEQPSAPYSMIDVHHAVFTQTNNLVTTLNILFAMREACPGAHLVKLGTMGEYGTPNVDIPEGFFEIEYRGRRDRLPFPRQAGSWYHQSKVHDSHNVMMACRIWGLRATDIMQGVVYGTRADGRFDDERLVTRFDFDQCFGTAVHRFCAQAVVGRPLTPYGRGRQRRGFIPLRDAMQCLSLALAHPPAEGEYRVFNQFAETYTVFELAERVQRVAGELGLRVEVRPTENPRIEQEEHYYNPEHEQLQRLGYKPTRDVEGEIRTILEDLLPHRSRILARSQALVPDIRWDGRRRKVRDL